MGFSVMLLCYASENEPRLKPRARSAGRRGRTAQWSLLGMRWSRTALDCVLAPHSVIRKGMSASSAAAPARRRVAATRHMWSEPQCQHMSRCTVRKHTSLVRLARQSSEGEGRRRQGAPDASRCSRRKCSECPAEEQEVLAVGTHASRGVWGSFGASAQARSCPRRSPYVMERSPAPRAIHQPHHTRVFSRWRVGSSFPCPRKREEKFDDAARKSHRRARPDEPHHEPRVRHLRCNRVA